MRRQWCRRPAVAGALAGLSGGAAFVVLSAALMLAAVGDGGAERPLAAVAEAGPRWLVRLAFGVLLGAALGPLVFRLVGPPTDTALPRPARRIPTGAAWAAGLGIAFGTLWWGLESVALAPFRPAICALVGEVGRGEAEASLVGLACYLAYGVVTGGALCACHLVASRALPAGARAARRLEVYIAAHCLSCAEACRLAEAAAQRFPNLDVHTIDVDALARTGAPAALPEPVVAVPTYLLDGAVIALGNPDPQQLFARIASAGIAVPPLRRGARALHA